MRRAEPAFTRGAVRCKRNLIVLDAGDVFDDAFAVRGPRIDAAAAESAAAFSRFTPKSG